MPVLRVRRTAGQPIPQRYRPLQSVHPKCSGSSRGRVPVCSAECAASSGDPRTAPSSEARRDLLRALADCRPRRRCGWPTPRAAGLPDSGVGRGAGRCPPGREQREGGRAAGGSGCRADSWRGPGRGPAADPQGGGAGIAGRRGDARPGTVAKALADLTASGTPRNPKKRDREPGVGASGQGRTSWIEHFDRYVRR